MFARFGGARRPIVSYDTAAAVSAISEPSRSSNITINYGSVNGLLVVLPGETRVEGKTSAPRGKSGTPNANFITNVSTTIPAYAVDRYMNTNTAASNQVFIYTPDDSWDTEPSSRTLTSGVTTFTITPVVAGTQSVRA